MASEGVSDEIWRLIRAYNERGEQLKRALAEVERLQARERPLLVLLRAVAKGEPLPASFMWQARGWLEAEEAEEEGGPDGASG